MTMMVACSETDPTEGIELKQTNVSLKAGEKFTIEPDLSKIGGNTYSISWSSNNKNIATVSSGVITAISEGNAIITTDISVYTQSKTYTKSLNCAVSVTGSIAIEGISFEKEQYFLRPEETLTLVPKLTPENAVGNLVWKTDDTTAISVDEKGVVTALSIGKGTVTVSSADGKFTASTVINVSEQEVSNGIKLNRDSIRLYIGESFRFTTTDSSGNLIWTVSDPNKAKVDSEGKVTALAAGKVEIAVSDDVSSATCTLTVMTKD